ncbi:MAG: WD40 repeat domain-containing protein, partial [Pirellulaceae bacterium]
FRENTSLIPSRAAWSAERKILCVVGERLGGMPGRALIVDLRTGNQLTEPLEFNNPVETAAFDATGKILAIADDSGSVQLFDPSTGEKLGIPMVHPDSVSELRFSADGRLLLTCCRDLNVRLFDVATSTEVTSPLVHQNETGTAEFIGTSYDVLTSGDGGTIWHVPRHRFSAEQAAAYSRYWSGTTMSERGAIIPVSAERLSIDQTDAAADPVGLPSTVESVN